MVIFKLKTSRMEASVFMNLEVVPVTNDLIEPLEKTFPLWMEIRDFVFTVTQKHWKSGTSQRKNMDGDFVLKTKREP